ncbi:MAG: hypothetical protein J6N71_11780, partial [Muribaculaceae bacterium]|nr:hypothetical protein [Muribaculaceae bacterium]
HAVAPFLDFTAFRPELEAYWGRQRAACCVKSKYEYFSWGKGKGERGKDLQQSCVDYHIIS